MLEHELCSRLSHTGYDLTQMLCGDPSAAITSALVIASIGIAVSAAEDLVRIDVFSDKGVLSWEILRVTQPAPPLLVLRRARDGIFTPTGFTLLLIMKAGAAIATVVTIAMAPHRKFVLLVLCATVLGSLVLLRRRTTYGLDGSDDMMTVTFLACTVFFACPSASVGQMAATMYIAVQSVLSYFVSGVAKLASPSWRRGDAIAGVLNTTIYGSPTVGGFLQGRHRLGLALSWAVIVFECLFVSTLFFGGTRVLYLILGVGVLFHASTAVLMGLNGFLWAFTATYPPVAFASCVTSGWLVASLQQ